MKTKIKGYFFKIYLKRGKKKRKTNCFAVGLSIDFEIAFTEFLVKL